MIKWYDYLVAYKAPNGSIQTTWIKGVSTYDAAQLYCATFRGKLQDIIAITELQRY